MLSTLKKINKKVIVFVLFFVFYLILQVIKMREIDIKDSSAHQDEYVFVADEAFFRIPVKENTDKIEFSSKKYEMNKEHLIRFTDNYLVTQKIRNLIFEGPIRIAFYNDESSDFNVPEYFILRNKANPRYIMEFNNANGVFDKGIFQTEKKFKINHKDFFLSGDNLFITNDFNDVLITKNSKLIDKKEKREDNMIITSEFFNYFKIKNEAIFRKNVHLIKKDLTTDSEFLHAFIREGEDKKEDIDSAIFKENVVFTHKKNSKIRSLASYFFKKENVFVFCDKVELEDEKGFSKADFYIYYVDTKKIVNLQENNKFFLEKIKQLDKDASEPCIRYEEKISKFIIKNEK